MDKKRFLDVIRQIESSGGKNIEHEPVKYGPQRGQTAIGEYGLLPSTVEEFVNRRKLAGSFGPDENIISKMSDEELTNLLNTQDRIEQNLADDIAKRVLEKSKGDLTKAAYMWNAGHNLSPEKITQEKLDKSDYDDKFKLYSNQLVKKNREDQFKKLKELVRSYNLNRQIASEPEGE